MFQFRVAVTDSPEGHDKEAAEWAVSKYNEWLLGQDESAQPLTYSTNVELKDACEVAITKDVETKHALNASDGAKHNPSRKEVREFVKTASAEELSAIIAIMNSRV